MKNLIKRTIAVLMVILMSFSVVAYADNNNFTVSAASTHTIVIKGNPLSIRKRPILKANYYAADYVKLSWGKTKGATSYRVYRSTDQKKWKLVKKTSKTFYKAKNLIIIKRTILR